MFGSIRRLGLVVGSMLFASGAARAAAQPDSQPVLAALDLWKQAMTKKDRAAFEKVLHPDLSYGHSNGLIETKAEAMAHVLDSKIVWEDIKITDSSVRWHRDTAFVTAKVQLFQRDKDKLTVIDLLALHVFVKGKGKDGSGWQLIARQATRPPAPAAASADKKENAAPSVR